MADLRPLGLFLVVAAAVAAGCRHTDSSHGNPVSLERIKVATDGKHFVTAKSGHNFVPFGFNYDRDYRMRLLEEYWHTEWATVASDFREMKELGATVIRIHLQFHQFMEGPGVPNRKNLDQLVRLLELAEETGLHLDLTGLACYRRTNSPAWYDALNEEQRWQAQAQFWQAVAGRCTRSPAVFCYNLMNEPLVPTGKRAARDWLTGELEGFSYVQCITLDQAGRPRPAIARAWIDQLTAAIRKVDRGHLITVGFLPNSLTTAPADSGFVPQQAGPPLDYLSVHLYPASNRLEADLNLLQGFAIGKPVVIEELFPLQCQARELKGFIERSRSTASGWLSFYWGQTPADLTRAGGMGAAVIRDWLETFTTLKP